MAFHFKQLLTGDKRANGLPESNFISGNSVKTPYASGEIGILGRPFALRLNELDSIGWLFHDNIKLKCGFIETLFALGPKIQVDVQTLGRGKSKKKHWSECYLLLLLLLSVSYFRFNNTTHDH